MLISIRTTLYVVMTILFKEALITLPLNIFMESTITFVVLQFLILFVGGAAASDVLGQDADAGGVD